MGDDRRSNELLLDALEHAVRVQHDAARLKGHPVPRDDVDAIREIVLSHMLPVDLDALARELWNCGVRHPGEVMQDGREAAEIDVQERKVEFYDRVE